MATAPTRQDGQFYRHVSARLGEGTYQAPADDDRSSPGTASPRPVH
ncbi:MAG: hypothetical protein ACRDNW_07025 [Trebonia sp.]